MTANPNSSNYNYIWSDGLGTQSTASINPTISKTFYVTITSATNSNCSATASIYITVNNPIVCTPYNISPTFNGIGYNGGVMNFYCQPNNPTCSWSIALGAGCSSMISMNTSFPQTGSQTVNYSVQPNQSISMRSCTLSVSGNNAYTHIITQDGYSNPCAGLALSSNSFIHTSSAGDYSFNIFNPNNCSWTISNCTNSFVSINSSSSGTNAATVYYSITKNTSTTERICSLWVNDKVYIIKQDGSNATLCPLQNPRLSNIGCKVYVINKNVYSNANVRWYDAGIQINTAPNSFVYENAKPGLYDVEIYEGDCVYKNETTHVLHCNADIDHLIKENIHIYPNPFLSRIFIDIKESHENIFMLIHNTIGEIVYKHILTNDQNEIELNHLPKGVYYLSIYSDQFNIKYKIIKE
jgi:hypothetical protein